jgi:hypothetical protein
MRIDPVEPRDRALQLDGFGGVELRRERVMQQQDEYQMRYIHLPTFGSSIADDDTPIR